MPTLDDVAKRAGVSTATVSKVLSNKPYFTEATRLKVMLAVDELGYVPHLAARALSSGKTGIIAVVFPYVYDTILTDPLVLRILEGVEAESSQRGYNILLSTPRVSTQGVDAHYQQLLQSGYIDGIIAMDNVPFSSVIQPARQQGIPAVAVGHFNSNLRVGSDDRGGTFQLMKHVTGLGHRNIGIIGVPEKLHYSIQHRIEGLCDGAEKAGLDYAVFPRADGDFSTSSGSRCAAQLLHEHPDLTALVCLNDRMAMGAIQYAHELGRAVPQDLTVVGYDDIPMAAAFSPPLTTIDQQAPKLGRAAAVMLFDVLNGRLPTPITLPTQLIVRQSSGPVR